MKKRHNVWFDLDAALGETSEGTVTLDGVEYYVMAVPADRVRALRSTPSGQVGLGGIGKTAINLGPLGGGVPNKCPMCGR
jgi:hypothetical protein